MGAWKRFMQEEDGMGVVEVILIIVVLVAMVLISKNRFLHWSRQSGQPLTRMRRKYIRRKQRQEENMNNKGRIVVFISMITAVMLVLITLVIQVVILSAAKSKNVIATRLSMSDIKACYNSYIFEHYHILLFDKTAGGKGEGYLEEWLEQAYAEKLGTEYTDVRASITDMTMLTDQSYASLKKQMQEYMAYAAAEKGVQMGVDQMKEKTGGQDGTLPEEVKEDMETAEVKTDGMDVADVDDTSDAGVVGSENMDEENPTIQPDVDDPRDYTKKLSSSIILNLVLPEDKTVSDATISLVDAPSLRLIGFFSDYKEVDRDFDSMVPLLEGLTALGSWQDSLTDTGIQLAYIGQVFNSYREEKNDTAVLAYEQEYLIAGKSSDYENLKSVAHRMIGIRYPINYIGLIRQPDKMQTLTELATSIAGAAPYLIPALKYFLAGCWAYIESIADVRILFDGKKAPFMKNADNWITDIEHISESLSKETEDAENGLDYQAYLSILQAMNIDGATARMLDLMQINTMQEEKKFRILHAAVGLEADFESTFGGHRFQYHQSAAY